MTNADEYIFFQDDPHMEVKRHESRLVREFEASLTPEEKADCRSYIKLLNWPVNNHVQRMNRNLALMCFMDGVRLEKIRKSALDPSYVQALFAVSVEEIAAWSNMRPDKIRNVLTQKIQEYVRQNQTQNKST